MEHHHRLPQVCFRLFHCVRSFTFPLDFFKFHWMLFVVMILAVLGALMQCICFLCCFKGYRSAADENTLKRVGGKGYVWCSHWTKRRIPSSGRESQPVLDHQMHKQNSDTRKPQTIKRLEKKASKESSTKKTMLQNYKTCRTGSESEQLFFRKSSQKSANAKCFVHINDTPMFIPKRVTKSQTSFSSISL